MNDRYSILKTPIPFLEKLANITLKISNHTALENLENSNPA